MNVKIGARIRELRRRDDVTQERLAETLGVTSQAISKWEGENGYPDIEYIAPIADFFNVTIDYLFDHDTQESRKKIEEYRDIVKKIQSIQDASDNLLNLINDVLGMPKAAEPPVAKDVKEYYFAEMKIPLNAIREMSSIGADTADVEKKDEAIQKIRHASNHLLGVINDILDASEIKAGKLTLASTEFNPERTFQKIAEIISARTNERRQKLTFNIDPAIPRTLVGDDQRLAQVIMNLLSNAVKFTPPEGAIDFAAKLQSEKDNTCTLLFSVSDTGIGISREYQSVIMNNYERNERDARRFGGIGLGLTIAKALVEMMGGKIWVESEPGQGSTFSFTAVMKKGGNA